MEGERETERETAISKVLLSKKEVSRDKSPLSSSWEETPRKTQQCTHGITHPSLMPQTKDTFPQKKWGSITYSKGHFSFILIQDKSFLTYF